MSDLRFPSTDNQTIGIGASNVFGHGVMAIFLMRGPVPLVARRILFRGLSASDNCGNASKLDSSAVHCSAGSAQQQPERPTLSQGFGTFEANPRSKTL